MDTRSVNIFAVIMEEAVHGLGWVCQVVVHQALQAATQTRTGAWWLRHKLLWQQQNSRAATDGATTTDHDLQAA
jgi:hypothetical protein